MAIRVPSQLNPDVFINFRGKELRGNFISHVVGALDDGGIKYYIDRDELRSLPIEVLFTRIQESKIALAIFSEHYGESNWCLKELGKIMRKVEEENLKVIPIFFNVTPEDVKYQLGEFGKHLTKGDRYDLPDMTQWRKDLNSVVKHMGMCLTGYRDEHDLVVNIIAEVKRVLATIPSVSKANMLSTNISTVTSTGDRSSVTFEHVEASLPPYEQRLNQLEEMLDFDSKVTQIVGIVGMAGIGKTKLARTHYAAWEKRRLVSRKILLGIREKSKTGGLSWLERELLDGESSDKAPIFRKKSFIVLDDVSEKKHIEFLLSIIKKGSKIVITTRDKSLIKGLVHDTYVVPGLNDREALQLFSYYAFNGQDYTPTENMIKMSKKFVAYGGGNPQALEELGNELCGKDEAHWKNELEKLPNCYNEKIRTGFRICYNELTAQQKDAFLDIACFFRSEDEDYVRSLLASDVSSGKPAREVTDLADKFMISISAGQIEMPDLLCSLGKELGLFASVENEGKSRLWNHEKAIGALVNREVRIINYIEKYKINGTECIRGIVLDVFKLSTGIAIDKYNLTLMPNLRYLKIFDSRCPRHCEVVDCKVSLPEKLELPLQEIRYLHWLKFPLKRLPLDFNPENLVDLRLPYSKIQRVWKVVKDTPNLKWVDLSHSTELTDLSALSKAESLERLNLEGCTMLSELPSGMVNMKRLAFLNLRGCTSLSSLPEDMDLISLKTLILSDCSNFYDFQVISKNLEHLHLDGTDINKLPESIEHLQRLIVLNLKNCERLVSLPLCLDKLKALEELILSGCSRLRKFPEIKENMENLQILLLDRTLIKELPTILLRCVNSIDQVNFQRSPRMSGLTLLRRLCLSSNHEISSLQSCISDLYHLKWIDLKNCRNLLSISTLPPNLQSLDAHACTSLKTVGSPLALLMPTEQVPSSFVFTDCEKLEHVAKNEITYYGHNKGWLLSKALNRHNKGFSFEALVSTCFPGSEVPTWFSHKAAGAVLKPELPRHWSESGFVGIALCAIVSFEKHRVQNNNLQVKCMCDFNNVKTSSSYFNCPVGGLSETGDEERTINSTHVFIGYTNWLNIKKCQEEDGKKGCVPTKASIKFEVTDDMGEVTNCKVLKCGFSLVYESAF
ncbi:unnamed protein product [Arabidopsis halleri]